MKARNSPLLSTTRFKKHAFFMLIIVAVLTFAYFLLRANEKKFMPVGLTGVQHIGENFNISEFYVDGYGGGNIGREGGGGSNVCCVLLPEKWRPGLKVELRWAVADWSKENRKEIMASNYRSVIWTCFKALVPVEKYDRPEQLYVHFFSGGRARVVSSFSDSESKEHPIQRDDPRAAEVATVGVVQRSIFTEAELAEMNRKDEKHAWEMAMSDIQLKIAATFAAPVTAIHLAP